MVYLFMVGMLRMPVSTRVLTALSVSFACIRLQATELSHYSCRFLSSFNLRGTHSAKTLWDCDMSTMIAAQCHRIHHSQMPYAVVFVSCPLSVFLDACVVMCCHRQLSSCTYLSSVTPFLPYANVWHHVANCWLDVTLLPFASRNCRRKSAAEKILEHNWPVNSRIPKPERISTCVTTLNFCRCAHIAHVPRIVRLSTICVCVCMFTYICIYISYIYIYICTYQAFEISTTSNFEIIWLVNILMKILSTSISKF